MIIMNQWIEMLNKDIQIIQIGVNVNSILEYNNLNDKYIRVL